MKIKNYIAILLVLVLGFTGCKKDDNQDAITVPERDRTEQQIADKYSYLPKICIK